MGDYNMKIKNKEWATQAIASKQPKISAVTPKITENWSNK
jgi:hypothetical protein